MSQLTVLERAFILARTGQFAGPGEIRGQLKAEGYLLGQLQGPSLLKQLRQICNDARAQRELS